MILELIETKKIMLHFDKTIVNSSFKIEYISDKANIPLPTLYRKIRENKFTVDEMLTILEIIEPEQYQYEMLQKNIEVAVNQIKNGQFIEEEDFIFDVDTILRNQL